MGGRFVPLETLPKLRLHLCRCMHCIAGNSPVNYPFMVQLALQARVLLRAGLSQFVGRCPQNQKLNNARHAATVFMGCRVSSASACSQSSRSCPVSLPRCSYSSYARCLIACSSSGAASLRGGVRVGRFGLRGALTVGSSILHNKRVLALLNGVVYFKLTGALLHQL